MKVWLYLESLNPIRWGIRFGKRWKICKKVSVQIPMETKRGKNAPHCYLYGEGELKIFRNEVWIRRPR